MGDRGNVTGRENKKTYAFHATLEVKQCLYIANINKLLSTLEYGSRELDFYN